MEVEDDHEDTATDDLLVWNGVVGKGEQLVINEELEDSQKGQLLTLLQEFDDVLKNTPGKTDMVEYRIHTVSAQPVRLPACRLPYAYRDRVKELDDMLQFGIIEPSSSEWSSPMVVVQKKDGTLRVCVDFRRLNSISECDSYPMQRIDELIDQLGKAEFITTIDLTKGYWQVNSTFWFIPVYCDAIWSSGSPIHISTIDGQPHQGNGGLLSSIH